MIVFSSELFFINFVQSFFNDCKYFHVVLCDGLSLSNGRVSYNQESVNGEYPVGTTASYTCNSGYNLKGPNPRTCQSSGTWTQGSPYCEQSNICLLFII